MGPCVPRSLAFEVSINGMYVLCDQQTHLHRYHFLIRKSFDNKNDAMVRNYRLQGMFGIVSELLLT